MNNLAKNLTQLRKSFKLTQDDIAAKVFVSRQAVSKWERGETTPDVDTLLALSAMYSVSVDDLLRSDEIAIPIAETKQIDNSEELKTMRRHKLAKQMTFCAISLLGVYALICGIIQIALDEFTADIWLLWFTLPIVPPIIFAVIFRNNIGKKWLMFFGDIPFVSGLLFLLIEYNTNASGAWLSFLLIPTYYAIAIAIFFSIRNNEKSDKRN